MSSSELDLWHSKVPEDQNRALLILNAAKRADVSIRITLPSGTSISPDTYQIIAASVTTNGDALNLLYKTVDLPASRFPIDLSLGADTMLPHLAQVKALVQLLRKAERDSGGAPGVRIPRHRKGAPVHHEYSLLDSVDHEAGHGCCCNDTGRRAKARIG